MPKRNRKTLKENFKNGRKPSEQDFENLIDSAINILDDGLSKNIENGISLAPLLGNETVMSIFRESVDDKPIWKIAVDNENGNLKIGKFENEKIIPFLTLNLNKKVEFGAEISEIKFNSQLNFPSRKGSFLSGKILANGKWQDISEELEGCWMLEIVAGCGKRHTGKHSLLIATATHCFGKKAKIKKIRSYYGSFGNQICLRWRKNKNNFSAKLQMKTIFNYGENVQINYHISKLWDNPFMEVTI
jgi:hypothetical protein